MVNPETILDDFDAYTLWISKRSNGVYDVIGMLHTSEVLSVMAKPRFKSGARVQKPSGEMYNFWDWASWLKEISENKSEAFDIVYTEPVYWDAWFNNIKGLVPSLLSKSLAQILWENQEFYRACYLLHRQRYTIDPLAGEHVLLHYAPETLISHENLSVYYHKLLSESVLPPQMDLGILSTIDNAGCKLRINLS